MVKTFPVKILKPDGSTAEAMFTQQYGMVTCVEWPRGVDLALRAKILIGLERYGRMAGRWLQDALVVYHWHVVTE